MKKYSEMTKEELLKEQESVLALYSNMKDMGLSLTMARGKPSPDQLDLSNGLLEACTAAEIDAVMAKGEVDPRNYGNLTGIHAARKLMAGMVGRPAEDAIIYGNSSLNMMFDTIGRACSKGVMGHTPWGKLDKVKFLCPAPGYDRHFTITEYFGFEMINIPMYEDGPDMDMIEDLVSKDDSIKGIWCVPKFSNPQGYVYSDETVRRFARLKPAAPDFRIFWDNAYCIHYLDEPIEMPDIIEECEKAGNPDLVYEFLSLSKVTFAGGSISAAVTSENNRKDILATLTVASIGHNKLNQLRHAIFFKKYRNLEEHMRAHAEIIRPKFEAIEEALDRDLAGLGVGKYFKPKGGYFITYEANEGCATRIVELAKEAGMEMTQAGACFPYGKDPKDSYIRIAPTFPSLNEIKQAATLFTICVKLASLEKLLKG